MKSNNPRLTRGFTLIEMIIVIALIAILAGIIIPETFKFLSSGRDTRRIGDLKNIQNYLELYYNTCGHYPDQAAPSSLPTNVSNSGQCDKGSDYISELVNAGVVSDSSKVPVDPSTHAPYGYNGTAGIGSSSSCSNTSGNTPCLAYYLGAQLEGYNNALVNSPSGYTISGGSGGACDKSNYYCVSSQ